MKYYVELILNNVLQKDEIEGFNDLNSAKAFFANKWAALENDKNVIYACIVILDQDFNILEGCKQYVTHPPIQESDQEQ